MSRNRRLVLAMAAGAVPFAHFLKPEGEGGGGADKPNDKGTKDKAKDDAPPPVKKIELTEEELSERINSATAEAVRKRDDAQAKKDRDAEEERERKKAEADGEFQKIADKAEEKRLAAEAERDAAKLDKRRLEVKDRLRDYLAEKHPAYVGVAKYITPLIDFDLSTDDKDIDKRIGTAADAYVKDNPRQAGAGGAPAQIGRGQRAAEGEKPKDSKDDQNGKERPLSRTARMAF